MKYKSINIGPFRASIEWGTKIGARHQVKIYFGMLTKRFRYFKRKIGNHHDTIKNNGRG